MPVRSSVLKHSKEAREPIVGRTWPWRTGSTVGETNGWHTQFMRYPALVRIFANADPWNFPRMSEKEMVRCMEVLWRDTDARKGIKVLEVEDTNIKVSELRDYILSNQRLLSAWIRHPGRAKSQFNGLRSFQERLLDGGRFLPLELAHMRLPDHLALDGHVVYMLAACQGLTPNHVKVFTGARESYPDVCSREYWIQGLEKLLTDRWFRFALTAPYISQFGIEIGYAGFTRTVQRVEYLIQRPYWATPEELDYIEASAPYKVAWAEASRNLGKTGVNRKAPHPGPVWMTGRMGEQRGRYLDDWCIWSRGKLRHGGY